MNETALVPIVQRPLRHPLIPTTSDVACTPREKLPAQIEVLKASLVPATRREALLASKWLIGSFNRQHFEEPKIFVRMLTAEFQRHPPDIFEAVVWNLVQEFEWRVPSIARVHRECAAATRPRQEALAHAEQIRAKHIKEEQREQERERREQEDRQMKEDYRRTISTPTYHDAVRTICTVFGDDENIAEARFTEWEAALKAGHPWAVEALDYMARKADVCRTNYREIEKAYWLIRRHGIAALKSARRC
jgi:hypothetical protein